MDGALVPAPYGIDGLCPSLSDAALSGLVIRLLFCLNLGDPCLSDFPLWHGEIQM